MWKYMVPLKTALKRENGFLEVPYSVFFAFICPIFCIYCFNYTPTEMICQVVFSDMNELSEKNSTENNRRQSRLLHCSQGKPANTFQRYRGLFPWFFSRQYVFIKHKFSLFPSARILSAALNITELHYYLIVRFYSIRLLDMLIVVRNLSACFFCFALYSASAVPNSSCILKKYFSEKRNVKSKKMLIIVEAQKYGRSYIYFCIFVDLQPILWYNIKIDICE